MMSSLPHGMDVPLRYPYVLLRRDLADISCMLYSWSRALRIDENMFPQRNGEYKTIDSLTAIWTTKGDEERSDASDRMMSYIVYLQEMLQDHNVEYTDMIDFF
jgi:hypothetical protein